MPNYPSTALDNYEQRTRKGQPNGYASLGPDGKVPSSQGGGSGSTGVGPQGPVGPQGLTGPAGAVGPSGASWVPVQSATAPATVSAGTIATAALTASRVSPITAITGVILAAGTIGGQEVAVTNESMFSITFAVPGTSNVATGTLCVIAALSHLKFVWSAGPNLWYPSGSSGGSGGPATYG